MVSAPRCPPGARGLLALLLLLPPGARGQCSSPPSFSFAQLSSPVRSIYPVGYRLRYSCCQGYTLDPQKSPVVTCGADSTWLIDPEFCVGKPCKPLELENGRVDLTDLRFAATATFSCNEGYKLIGPISTQCVLAGNRVNWDKEVPRCQAISCRPPPDITRGSHNALIGAEFTFGSAVTYKCDEGFSLIGEASINCTTKDDLNGEWSGPPPKCKEIRCPSPDITNGKAIPRKETYVYEDKIRIECNPGYALKDKNGLIKCEHNRAWHPPLPICEPACEPPARITNGWDDRSRKNVFLVGSSVSYSCNRGWSLVGVSSIRCTAGDQGTPRWDPPVPECKACEPPARISNGRDDRGWENIFLVGSSVTYECKRGWSLVGVSSIRCTAGDGGTPRWDAPVPECKEIRCPSPDITNGKAIPRKETYVYEDKIRIECNPGYALKDKNGLIKCEHNHAWHPPLPICERACEPPARISNGRDDRGWRNVFLVGSSVTYDCDRGWSLVGVASIRCTAGDGGTPRWDAPVPECKACEPPARISNGRDDRGWENVFLVGSSVTYDCDRGWSLVGVSSIRCTAGDGGTPCWDAPVPECKEIPRCPNPVIEHGKQISIRETEYTVGNRIEFQCESGYILKGSKSIECQANGTWDPPMPSCIKGEANRFSSVKHGFMRV